MKVRRKCLSIVLSIVLVVALCPGLAFADSGGSLTANASTGKAEGVVTQPVIKAQATSSVVNTAESGLIEVMRASSATIKATSKGWWSTGSSLITSAKLSGAKMTITGYRDAFIFHASKLGEVGQVVNGKKCAFKLKSKTKVVIKSYKTGKTSKKRLGKKQLTKLIDKRDYLGISIKVSKGKVAEVRLS